MEGTLVTHYFEEKADSLSGPELYELQDENGLPLWFSRHLFKDVCISGVCKMIRLWMFWDGAGNYLGMHIPEDEPLTKSDHTLFKPADYEKLEGILRDTASILQDMKQEDLIIVPDTINPYEVDGYTAATQPTLAEAVVKDAVYTCHTLWHTAYGPVQDTVLGILDARVNEDFLEKMFSSQKTEYVLWAIDALEKHSGYHPMFYPAILSRISSDDYNLSKKALNYFQPSFLSDTSVQVQLVKLMNDTDRNTQYEILWKLIGLEQVNETAVINLLMMFQDQKLGVGTYNLILRLVNENHINKNKQINQLIHSLTENENAYIRNLTTKKLGQTNHKSSD
ncbi:MAG: hypothetical protein ACOC0R_06160 [Mariniphaga sp.]